VGKRGFHLIGVVEKVKEKGLGVKIAGFDIQEQ